MAVASESYAPSVLVSTEGLPEKDWLEYRRRGIGGSDAAAILGISPFATARDLYYDKLKIVPFDDSESNWVAKKMGHLLEDLVAEIFHVKRDIASIRSRICFIIRCIRFCWRILTIL